MNKRKFTALLLFLMMICTQASALSLLLIGVDETDAGLCSEAMLALHVNPDSADVRMVSFERNLAVQMAGYGQQPLRMAYAFGGETLLAQTLEENFGVTAERSAVIRFSLLADLVDQLGGVELGMDGETWMNGQQVLEYLRSEGSHQQLMDALLRKASEASYWDLLSMAMTALPQVETTLKMGDVLDLLPLVSRLDALDMRMTGVPGEIAAAAEVQSFLYGE